MKSRLVVGLVFLIFFVISLVTNILGSIIPNIIEDFGLSLFVGSLVTFSFFIAYGVMSIPAGVLLDRYGQKPILIAAFVLAFGGSFLFASMPTFTVALMSLFMIGIGMTMLQVAINPLLRVAGGEENFAFYSVMGQLVFGSASFLSPHVYSYLVTNLGGDAAPAGGVLGLLAGLVPSELPWVSLYWVFTVVTLVMILVLFAVRLPKVELAEDEKAGAAASYLELLKHDGASPNTWIKGFLQKHAQGALFGVLPARRASTSPWDVGRKKRDTPSSPSTSSTMPPHTMTPSHSLT